MNGFSPIRQNILICRFLLVLVYCIRTMPRQSYAMCGFSKIKGPLLWLSHNRIKVLANAIKTNDLTSALDPLLSIGHVNPAQLILFVILAESSLVMARFPSHPNVHLHLPVSKFFSAFVHPLTSLKSFTFEKLNL